MLMAEGSSGAWRGGGGGEGGCTHKHQYIASGMKKHVMTRDDFPCHRYVSRKANRIADSFNSFLAFTSFKTEPR